MKMNKMKVMSTIGALGLTASVLAGCGAEVEQEDDDYVKVVNSEGETMYIDEDEFEEANNGGGGMGMFLLFSSWNGNNHSGLKSSKGYKGSSFKTKPSTSSGAKSGAKGGKGIGGKSSGAKSGGFGG